MYLVVIAWLYVVLMMAVAEATNAHGSVLGASITFVLYGVLPLSILVYLMRSPARARARKAREREQWQAELVSRSTSIRAMQSSGTEPDAGSHAAARPKAGGITPVRKKV